MCTRCKEDHGRSYHRKRSRIEPPLQKITGNLLLLQYGTCRDLPAQMSTRLAFVCDLGTSWRASGLGTELESFEAVSKSMDLSGSQQPMLTYKPNEHSAVHQEGPRLHSDSSRLHTALFAPGAKMIAGLNGVLAPDICKTYSYNKTKKALHLVPLPSPLPSQQPLPKDHAQHPEPSPAVRRDEKSEGERQTLFKQKAKASMSNPSQEVKSN